ncbi:EF-Hand 1, calcium-binding site [Phytophthora cactorum]|nr:EF-Hand 1, calcium-binding site [Phytophthora cactorum]
MGCTQSTDVIRPNMFQTKLCMHHKTPATDVYRSLGELGRGAFGVVEKVEHLKTHRQYAMKTVRFESGSKRHEFEKEMGILRVLHHPNIVRMLETFEDDHHFYIIMELSSGGTLLDRVKARNKEFPEDEAKGLFAPFYGHTEDELVESIFAGEVSYTGKVWDMISPEAKALLRKLLHLQELYLAPGLMRFQLDLEKIFSALDQQNENGINLLEFVAATISPEDAADEELLLSTFYVLDRSHRGAITTNDLKALLVQRDGQKADADKDGQVNYNDFFKMMKFPTTSAEKRRVRSLRDAVPIVDSLDFR